MEVADGLGVLVVLAVAVGLPVLAIADLARTSERWTWRETLATALIVAGGPFAAVVFLVVNRFVSRAPRRPGPPHPLLRHVEDLYAPWRPDAGRDYDPVELVRWALSDLKDEWAARALGWLEQGAPVDPVRPELRALAAESRRPHELRARARSLLAGSATPTGP